jgi:hypothetical protein
MSDALPALKRLPGVFLMPGNLHGGNVINCFFTARGGRAPSAFDGLTPLSTNNVLGVFSNIYKNYQNSINWD